MPFLSALFLCLGCEAAIPVALPVASQVDVELVLAVDVSRSMDAEEFELQREGYVEAIRHPDFIHAVQQGAVGRIAITYFEWAGAVRNETIVPWQVIDSAESADAFAAQLESRHIQELRGTSISRALDFGRSLFDFNTVEGERKVIDISGDGPNNIGPPVEPVRDEVVKQGIIINGLPILIRPSATAGPLDRYYAECVIGGPGAFVLPIRDASEFATAIRRKLILEIGGLQPDAVIVPAQAEEPIDCQRGERDRRFFSDPYFPELNP